MNGAGPIVERFFALQRRMYTGGPVEPLESLLADDVTWHVPGRSPIAGDYVGRRDGCGRDCWIPCEMQQSLVG